MSSSWLKVTSSGAAAVAMVALAAAPASAALEVDTGTRIADGVITPSDFDDPQDRCVDSPAARVCYKEIEDGIYVLDAKRDGNNAVGWWVTGDREGQCVNTAGYGKWAWCDKNFTEDRIIDIWTPYDGRKYRVTTRA
ncbi:hypothetical protein ACFZC6_14310 [Streptomyces ossamyceticus]|jgi:hypothetical protein|uniref:Secreted protein n=1 Tax=Streptomyces ossamyceticus TaxID=249581 RepID=A0ABV2V6X1_9ACTN